MAGDRADRRSARAPLPCPNAADEAAEEPTGEAYKPTGKAPPKGKIACYDPSTMRLLGYAKAMTPAEVGGVLLLMCVLCVWGCGCGRLRRRAHVRRLGSRRANRRPR